MAKGIPLPPETQKRIKELLREGKDYNEIGQILSIAPNSVGNYLKSEIIRSYMKKTKRL